MAAYYRLPSGLWRAQINRHGVRRSQAFPTKGQAVAWATQVETEVISGTHIHAPNITLSDLLDRYEKEVSTGKKGEKWEKVRLAQFKADRIAAVRLRQLDAPHLSDWQKRRLAAVSAASVRRERNLLNHVFEIARKEWKWLAKNPFEGVRRPKDAKPRSRVASPDEIEKLLSRASPTMNRVVVFALETGMRASEIAALSDVRGRVACLHDSKTGQGRDVPLSTKALEVWQGGFTITAGSISSLFARLCRECHIVGLTFHDLRRTAIVALAKKLAPMELAKMVGHKDLRMTLNVYYKADAEEMAKKLA